MPPTWVVGQSSWMLPAVAGPAAALGRVSLKQELGLQPRLKSSAAEPHFCPPHLDVLHGQKVSGFILKSVAGGWGTLSDSHRTRPDLCCCFGFNSLYLTLPLTCPLSSAAQSIQRNCKFSCHVSMGQTWILDVTGMLQLNSPHGAKGPTPLQGSLKDTFCSFETCFFPPKYRETTIYKAMFRRKTQGSLHFNPFM